MSPQLAPFGEQFVVAASVVRRDASINDDIRAAETIPTDASAADVVWLGLYFVRPC